MFEAFLPTGLAFIMLTIGLGLTRAEFGRVIRQPKAIAFGLANQILFLPAVAAALLLLFQGRPEFAVGFMLLAACPGGITSNLLTLLAGGSTALSVAMTAISSLLSIVTVPLILGISLSIHLGAGHELAMPVERIIGGVVAITGVPILTGMILRWRFPETTERFFATARRISTGIFALIVAGAFVGQMDNIVTHFWEIGPYLLALNGATLSIGFFGARRLGLSQPDAIAAAMEGGLQNAALAIFIAVNVLNAPAIMIPAIVYALVMNVTAAAFIAWIKRTAVERA